MRSELDVSALGGVTEYDLDIDQSQRNMMIRDNNASVSAIQDFEDLDDHNHSQVGFRVGDPRMKKSIFRNESHETFQNNHRVENDLVDLERDQSDSVFNQLSHANVRKQTHADQLIKVDFFGTVPNPDQELSPEQTPNGMQRRSSAWQQNAYDSQAQIDHNSVKTKKISMKKIRLAGSQENFGSI